MASQGVVWTYFTKLSDNKAKCNLCLGTYNASSGMTNLRKHLECKHPSVLTVSGSSSPSRSSSPSMSFASGSSQPTIDELFTDYSSTSSGDKKINITSRIAVMIAKDNMPLNTVNGEGFRCLMKYLVPNYTVPDRKTIKSRIDELYDRTAQIKRREIESIPSLSLTFDMWKETNNNIHYLGVTGHYIKEWQMHSILLSCKNFDERHTAANICLHLDEIVEFWGFDRSKIIACVTGNGANNAIENSGNFKKIVDKVRSIVQYFKQSSPAADELRRAQPQGIVLKVKQDVETRWNSAYLMLARYMEIRDFISLALGRLNDAPQSLMGTERDIVGDSILLLRPFFKITKDMSAEKIVTLSKAIPIISCVTKAIKHMKPTTSDVDFNDKTFIPNALNKISEMIPSTSPPLTQESSEEEQEEDNFRVHHDKVASKRQQEKPATKSGISSKLNIYFKSGLENRKDNVLSIWNRIQSSYWEVYQIASKYLSIPATSVPSERLFSKAGSTITHKRNRMSPDTLNKLLFLNSLTLDELLKRN
ncbi:E3 SUMO-protein ligase ZBED1-like [Brevipalpus obovatus]|uniref:E3 SUMO-protein ligase ZBED1-like n=1 Tax=Brevipalpus obovatus TaxID=246614 RepID=UPI003D9EC3A0